MPSFLDNAESLGVTPLPAFGDSVGSTIFPTSVNSGSAAAAGYETSNVVNNSVSGAQILGTLGSLAGLYLGFKTADAQLKAATPASVPPTATAPAAAQPMSEQTKKLLTYGGLALVALLAVGLVFRRK